MLYWKSHSLLLVRPYKTGSTSLRKTLYNILGDGAESWDCHPHADWKEIKARVPADIIQNAYKVTVVRNPYTWFVSIYHYTRWAIETNQHWVSAEHMNCMELTFPEWVTNRYRIFSYDTNPDFYSQTQWTSNCDLVARLENLEALAPLWHYLKIEPPQIPHLKQGPHDRTASYYTPELKDMMKQMHYSTFVTFYPGEIMTGPNPYGDDNYSTPE